MLNCHNDIAIPAWGVLFGTRSRRGRLNGPTALLGYRRIGFAVSCALLQGLEIMRLNIILAFAAVAAPLSLAAHTLEAADFGRDGGPRESYSTYEEHDPYAYVYEPRGYYPYYNSGYWGPPRIKRFRGQRPPYFASWGAPDRNYYHREWHERHFGGHRRGNW
jgi:hypothetical protein